MKRALGFLAASNSYGPMPVVRVLAPRTGHQAEGAEQVLASDGTLTETRTESVIADVPLDLTALAS